MVLRLTDISVFVANWNNKVENIQYIQQVLNIAFDSIIFIDDNPFEREMVKTHIPEITVPDLPEDPVEYLSYLRQHYAFETASYTKEDEGRTQLYKIEAQRVIEQHAFTNEGDFLSSLNMLSDVQPFNEYAIPRIAQLTQRSNQFNLRTIRYTDDDIHAIAMDKHYRTYSFNLLDKFGDYGLISAVILKIQEKTLFINTWIMSCRVLKRSMEAFIINQIIELAKQEGFELIVAEYIPTQKNVIVKDLYPELGFSKLDKPGNFYELNIQQSNYIKTFIKKK